MRTHLSHGSYQELRRLLAAGHVTLISPRTFVELERGGLATLNKEGEARATVAGFLHVAGIERACRREVA